MSRVYKVSLYVADPNNDCNAIDIGHCFYDAVHRFHLVASDLTVLCGENEFEWNDNVSLNSTTCPTEEWEKHLGNPTKEVYIM